MPPVIIDIDEQIEKSLHNRGYLEFLDAQAEQEEEEQQDTGTAISLAKNNTTNSNQLQQHQYNALNPGDNKPKNKYVQIKAHHMMHRHAANPDMHKGKALPSSDVSSNHDSLSHPRIEGREYVSIHDDIYNMFFISPWFSTAFWYALYVFLLKLTLFSLVAKNAIFDYDHSKRIDFEDGDEFTLVLAAQFVILPVAVAMQDDLTASFFLFANIKYSKCIENENPHATKTKWNIACMCRALDGSFSLLINFVVLLSAEAVLSMFLNFAALQFLQTVDNIALDMCYDGFLNEELENVSRQVRNAELPKRSDDNWLRSLDTVQFLATVTLLTVIWIVYFFVE